MGKSTANTKGLKDIQKYIEKMANVVRRKQGTVDLGKEKIFVEGGPFLHQSTDKMSEEDSAAFERDSPELFNFLRALDDELREM